MLRLVRQVRAAILHLRDLRVRVVRILPLVVRQLLLALAVETSQIRPRRRRHAGRLRQTTHERVVVLPRVAAHDAPQSRVRLQSRRVHPHRLARHQTRIRQNAENPPEHLAVSLHVDQTPSTRNRRMIRSALGHRQTQKTTNAQRILSPPSDAALRVQTLEVPQQQQTKVPARSKTRATHPLRVEPRTLRLHELVETRRLQNPVQPLVERMTRAARQIRSRNPQRLLTPATILLAHRHERILCQANPTFTTGCYGSNALFEQSPDDSVRDIYETNVFGLMNVMRRALPDMRARGAGCIVNVTSMAGLMGLLGNSVYSSSKFAVEGLTEALALEYKPLGIRIVSVAPGAYLTTAFGDNTDNYIEAGDPQLVEHSEKLRDHFAAIVSGGKPQDPQEVADRIYECVTADDVPVHNPVGADAERLSGLIDSLPSRQAFVAAMEQMLLPPAG